VLGNHVWDYIGASGIYSCGLRQGGQVYCWGRDYNGELGLGTLGVGTTSPKPIVGDVLFLRIAVGFGTNCGITATFDAYCWGSGLFGERGDGTTAPQMGEPVKVQLP